MMLTEKGNELNDLCLDSRKPTFTHNKHTRKGVVDFQDLLNVFRKATKSLVLTKEVSEMNEQEK